MLIIDGVRRIKTRVWVDNVTPADGQPTEASAALRASYAAGAIRLADGPAGIRRVGRHVPCRLLRLAQRDLITEGDLVAVDMRGEFSA
jgi:hypothetical protein